MKTHTQLPQCNSACSLSSCGGVQGALSSATSPFVSITTSNQAARSLSWSSCNDEEDELTHAFKPCRLVSRSPRLCTAQGRCLIGLCFNTDSDLNIADDGLKTSCEGVISDRWVHALFAVAAVPVSGNIGVSVSLVACRVWQLGLTS